MKCGTTAVVGAIGAVVFALGAYFTWSNLRVTQESLKAAQQRLEVDHEAQITNRFSRAIELLGATTGTKLNLEARLGGIYALERVARDSPRDHAAITEVLTAYVRHNAPWKTGDPHNLPEDPRPRIDVQTMLSVLSSRNLDYDLPGWLALLALA